MSQKVAATCLVIHQSYRMHWGYQVDAEDLCTKANIVRENLMRAVMEYKKC